MKLYTLTVREIISQIKAAFKGDPLDHPGVDTPFRAELFTTDQMAYYAKTLAATHRLRKKPVAGHLIKRLDENEKVLKAVRKLLVDAIKVGNTITPAGEWLIDNFYLVEEQIYIAKAHLPRGYSLSLPQLLHAPTPATTRVYDIALKIVSHSDGRIDESRLSGFIEAYQTVHPLRLGELWAIPIMLRLTLIENLRRVCATIATNRLEINLANHWVKRLNEMQEKDPKNLILVIGDMARSDPPMTSAFVSEMNRHLMGRGIALSGALNWIEQRLLETGRTVQELVNAEIHIQAANQVSVSNSIGSLRLLASIDWRDFVEFHSFVERILRREPCGIYGRMDFATRDTYRHVVEHISRQAKLSEEHVATLAVKLATEMYDPTANHRHKQHVGYYLIGKGQAETRKAVGLMPGLMAKIRKVASRNRFTAYLGAILITTTIISALFLLKAAKDISGGWWLVCIAVPLVLSASQLAVSLANFFSTLIVGPQLLPKMNFSKAIPDEYRTLVVIPCLLIDEQSVEELIESIEVRFLANRNANLFFGLLTDYADAPSETMPEDTALLSLAELGITKLKKKYEKGSNEIFYLFHRPRVWNSREKIWMGRERKRGKLGDLNRLLRGEVSKDFLSVIGDVTALQKVKFVLTLDADTQLPRGAAWKMVATLAHPLNQPVFCEKMGRVIEGYGILQPRVTVSMPEATSSIYTRLHSNEPGIDPYTRAVSDVYQDLFGEGSFIGKGIYDVEIFERALEGRFQDNRILSHDLLEGCYARSGLLSDVQLFEKYPSSYQSDMKRRSRWIRGDWQIFPWFLPLVPDAAHHLRKNPLSNLSRWKIFDNIRRSLVPVALTVLIVVGWTLLKEPLFWTLVVTGIIVFPIFVAIVWNVFRKSADIPLVSHLKNFAWNTRDIIRQTFYAVICLPYEAYVSLKAIAVTSWRLLISHRNLLQWSPSVVYDRSNLPTLSASYARMWFAPFLSIVTAIILMIYRPVSLISSTPVILLWALSPVITWRISRHLPKKIVELTQSQLEFLRMIARKTWGFFECFVTRQENWLPPDNFQLYPAKKIAHRTSPTNIGMSLLANLSAYDFGYISAARLLHRTTGIIGTLKKMTRFRGHFFNWYDTTTLAPLLPEYISTVDSGNLAGHLLTLRQGLFEVLHSEIIHPAIFEGLADTLSALKETIPATDSHYLDELSDLVQKACAGGVRTPSACVATFKLLLTAWNNATESLHPENESDTEWWLQSMFDQINDVLENIEMVYPWISLSQQEIIATGIIFPDENLSLIALDSKIAVLRASLASTEINVSNDSVTEWSCSPSVRMALDKAQKEILERIAQLEGLGHDCIVLADMDWRFLYNNSKHLLSIGYRLQDSACDTGYYDLLASEARLGIFVAIAQGKLPEDCWFALGRQLTNVQGDLTLLSWSGSMFEYLMPLLIMPTYENTLLDETYKASVQRQIAYGRQRGIPWGISESGYNRIDAASNYQYRAFGVPGLGLKRGLESDLVIAPYATALALMVDPGESCNNLQLMEREGYTGNFGFYEAIDYTSARLQRNQSSAIIQSFMAHHQGMSLLSIGYLLKSQPMQRRFEADSQFRATMLLLQERAPKTSSFYIRSEASDVVEIVSGNKPVRTLHTPNTPVPEVHLLSNDNYHLMVTNSGGGYSRWRDYAITRWREDGTCDSYGFFCYIRDVETGTFWSSTYHPTNTIGGSFEVVFTQGRADFHNSNSGVDAHTEIVVSPEGDIEIRRITLTNRLNTRRLLELTSYAEVVIAKQASDETQSAFSNLFVQTKILKRRQSIICTRRPRSADEHSPWMFHSMMSQDSGDDSISFETDRMAFIGRGNTPVNPIAMTRPGPLLDSEGSVLDPIVAIRSGIALEPGESKTFDLIIGIAGNREDCESLIEKYSDRHHKERVFELAWTHSQVILRQINATENEEQLFGKMATFIIYVNAAMRASTSILVKNRRGQSGLWGYAISGDIPIVLLQIADGKNIEIVQQLIKAHIYWRLKGLLVDLVIWNEDHDVYRQNLQTQIQALIPQDLSDKPGGIFLRVADQISAEDRILFQTVARVIIGTDVTNLEALLKEDRAGKSRIPYLGKRVQNSIYQNFLSSPNNLKFFNGTGGFSADGKEYVIVVKNGTRTPLPWVNILANSNFGSVVSESGSAYTWVENAHELRLTPWKPDPVCDRGGEVFYLRDEESGYFWSPTIAPCDSLTACIIRHGFGYSTFEAMEQGISSHLSVFVDTELAVKFCVLKLRNLSAQTRKLSVTGYVELVLGDLRSRTAMHVNTVLDPTTSALFAENSYSSAFRNRVVFFDTNEAVKTITCDRTEFIGRNNSLKNPDALLRTKLSGNTGMGLDPCAAIQVVFEIAEGEEREIIFTLGAASDKYHARDLISKTRGGKAAQSALEDVKAYWGKITGALEIDTPDEALNFLTNGWLTYQTLACRLWARSGYYQSGGAFGFRDQLQDVLAVLITRPDLARKHILLCAAHQFEEGDVQHWWHPPGGQGVRTRISDDYLWLPYVTSRYIQYTGDTAILDERVSYLKERLLFEGEESFYGMPEDSRKMGKIYEHCVMAIKNGLRFGEHGLPLIGTGDWNDGMDKVGAHGRGESVWLGWFLYDVLTQFQDIATLYGDIEFSIKCAEEAARLKGAIELVAWDGEWYHRAYFDDGSPLGSAKNIDGQIDGIVQSWSVLSGGGERQHTISAMNAAWHRLVREKDGIIQLLDPPFDRGPESPGYIKGYVPGVRENGGQYTHSAIWLIMAFAKLRDRSRTWELLKLINPINHGSTAEEVRTYKVEPYVMAADVYGAFPHIGRGGWTWYTGSAGWMYQLVISSFIGLRVRADYMYFEPCLPEGWRPVHIKYLHGKTQYRISIEQKAGVSTTITVNGRLSLESMVPINQEDEVCTVVVVSG